MDTNPCKILLSGNVAPTSEASLSLTAESNITFLNTGEYLMTGVIYLNSGYVSNVQMWESANLI